MNLTYEKCGDYLIPNIIPNPEPEGELRKFGLMRKHYLKECKSGIYQGMILTWILGNVTRIPRHELPQTLDFSDFLPLFT